MRIVSSFIACALFGATIPPNQVPFHIEATEDVSREFPDAPKLQSFSFGQWKGRWVFIGGRIAGYHGVGGATADFVRADANREIWVVDTTVKPARTHHVPIDRLPARLAPVKEQWMSTAQLHYQDGSKLYICGGYGVDHAGNWVTFPIVSQADLPALIDSVMRGEAPAASIRFASSPAVQSSGGELTKLADGFFYLAMGHVFMGSYTAFEGQGEKNGKAASQSYLNEIRKLKIEPGAAPGTLEVSQAAAFKDPVEFRRRDMNIGHVLTPKGLGFAVYGGVFTPETQSAYSKPIFVFPDSEPLIDKSFDQRMNSYNCARLLMYDSQAATMHTTFFGGISGYLWDGANFVENPRLGAKDKPVYRDGLEWSDQISTISRGKDSTTEIVHPDTLPGALGSGAVFIPLPTVARMTVSPDILDFDKLRGSRTLVGYIYGGIRAFPFHFPYNKNAERYNSGTVPTRASEAILKVYIDSRQ